MNHDLSFIEVQFPVSKVSKESYKERKAGQSQTLTGLGKWWGRKPLILVRATLLGLLMPSTKDPVKDRGIFLKILMMDAEGVWKRKNKPMDDKVIIDNLTFKELKEYFEVPVDLFTEGYENQDKLIKQALNKNIGTLKWKEGTLRTNKDKATKLAFDRLSYDDCLEYCLRPEEIQLEDKSVWAEINQHLGTNVNSLPELMRELGIKKFGHVPTVGDCFAGGGSIPFESTRVGLKAYASDLNPLAGLLTWAGLNILSLPDKEIKKLVEFQEKVFDEVCRQVEEWGIEKNEKGWMAKYYLYCNETVCPHCKTKVPMAPSWWVSKKTKTVALLKYNSVKHNFDIDIIQNATSEQIKESERLATVKDGALLCPKCTNSTPITVLRRDDIDTEGKTVHGLRRWEANEFLPRKDDVFQERLYAIKYLEKNNRKTWAQFLKKPAPATDATYGTVHYVAPTTDDLKREEKVISLLNERFVDWQKKGYLPSAVIKPGDKTDEPIRTRGWQYWHQLFNPRQLLLCGLLAYELDKLSENIHQKVFGIVSLNRSFYYASKICLWDAGGDKGQQTFYNQALNTLYNYACRGLAAYYNNWVIDFNPNPFNSDSSIATIDARIAKKQCDYWITDPPYADAVNYHELSEFFLAWDKELIKKAFPEWYTDSKRVLAVKGTGLNFNQSMIEIYRNLANHMPDNGMQVVMFTHQSPAVWANLTLILWSAGLHVTAAWNIATETESGGLKEGNYVKGTVLLVLRKRTTEATAFTDVITFEIQEEVKQQIDSMRSLEDKEDPNFSDADYLLAAYAATLKILTSYKEIGGINVEYELSKPRDSKVIGPVEAIINNAIRTAYDYLIPQAFDSYIWKNLSAEERFFIKGMELEKSNVHQLGAYQEMARGFGVKDFKDMLASTKANQVRFKTPSEFGNRWLRVSDSFSNTLLRQVFMAIAQSEKEQNGQAGRAWLKNEVEEYWNKRQTIIELLRYLSTTEHIDHMQHWQSPALYAKYLIELVSSDGV
ncbi:MAG TPA: DNA methylase [Lentisphaeria bacterium]|nr:MAG: DNA methylase [Lentisphaerae bacterium GWF2_38_69]HBM14777.1 DNA methylase [Lentisphaeria bacterium]